MLPTQTQMLYFCDVIEMLQRAVNSEQNSGTHLTLEMKIFCAAAELCGFMRRNEHKSEIPQDILEMSIESLTARGINGVQDYVHTLIRSERWHLQSCGEEESLIADAFRSGRFVAILKFLKQESNER